MLFFHLEGAFYAWNGVIFLIPVSRRGPVVLPFFRDFFPHLEQPPNGKSETDRDLGLPRVLIMTPFSSFPLSVFLPLSPS